MSRTLFFFVSIGVLSCVSCVGCPQNAPSQRDGSTPGTNPGTDPGTNPGTDPPKTFPKSEVPFSVKVSHFTMHAPFAPNSRWRRGSTFGQCSSVCPTPRRMYTALKKDTILVAWSSLVKMVPSVQWGGKCDANKRGNVSTFSISPQNVITFKNTVKLDYCDEVGEITTSDDGSITAVLCVTSRPKELPTLTNDATKSIGKDGKERCCQWCCNSKAGRNKTMALLEWKNSKPVSEKPDSTVIVLQSIGGWNTGNFELDITQDKSKYFISLKNTRGSHEAMMSYFLRRSDWKRDFDAGACAFAHPRTNKIVRNRSLGIFGAYCSGDGSPTGQEKDENGNKKGGSSISFRTYHSDRAKHKAPTTEIRWCDPKKTYAGKYGYHAQCRPSVMISYGKKGFVGVAVGGGPTPDLPEVGVIHLPTTSQGYDKSKHQYKWLKELPTYGHKYKRWNRKGFPMIQHIGPGGENGNLFLFGWSPMSGWEPREHALALLDSKFNVLGKPLRLPKSGTRWGEFDEWMQLPNGCVLWSYTWIDGANGGYGRDRHKITGSRDKDAGTDTRKCIGKEFSPRLSITVVCLNK